ncbi:MAG: twin-arginine translocase subunit TatC, partial [Thiotrichales bacterium]|nr:twin-arginine translocase subunit TatC [Thiotrichales bacterium]
MIATEIAAPFLAPFKLTLFVAVYLAMPYILLQGWLFVAPGLYDQEKRYTLPIVLSSVVLFYIGTLFALFIVAPLLYAFFNATAPQGVVVMPDISRFLDFILKLAFGFGLAFEVPVITFMSVKLKLVDVETLRKKRPYIIVSAFVFAMLLTPPDVVSQLLLAIPILVLFELALFLSSRTLPDGEKQELV